MSHRRRLLLRNENGKTSLTPPLVSRLLEELQAPATHSWVTLEGEPGSFCDGLDLEVVAHADSSAAMDGLLGRFARLLQSLERHPRPVVALINGSVLGGGVGLAAAADLVLASPRSTFALPEGLVGLIPAVVLPTLTRRIGVTRARALALGRAPLSAEEALRAGLIDEVAEDPERALRRHSNRFERMSPDALAAIKDLMSRQDTAPDALLAEGTRRFAELLASPSTQARLRRFLAGETPWPLSSDPVEEDG